MVLPLLLALLSFPAFADPVLAPLQPLIDATPPGGTLRLPPGTYEGPATIVRPLVLDGGGRASLEDRRRGTVLTLRTGGATLRGLRIAGSGDSHDRIDAGLLVEGDDNLIEDNRIEDSLFGIHVRAGNRNRIVANRITGKDLPLGQRGDGLRLWNGRHNLITGNDFHRVRDLTLANAPNNTVAGNTLTDGRYGMQLIFSPGTVITGNRLSHTGTGIVALYSPDLTVRANRVAHALDGGGAGLAFRDSGGSLVQDNEVLHCAVGLQANAPANEGSALTIRGNRFSHNIVGLFFYGEKGGHRIAANRFDHNLTQVAMSSAGTTAASDWEANHWSDYQGFDRDGDGTGDTAHEVYSYADRLWMETPAATFFRNSPALELLDFLERLAPFAAPALLLRDARPRMP